MVNHRFSRSQKTLAVGSAVVLLALSAVSTVQAASAAGEGAAAQHEDGAQIQCHRDHDQEYSEGLQIVVRMKSNKKPKHIERAFDVRTLARISKALDIWRLAVPDGTNVDELADRMSDHKWVVWAYPSSDHEPPHADPKADYGWTLAAGADEYLAQTATELLGLTSDDASGHGEAVSVHSLARGEGVVVHVLDTGMYRSHPQLDEVVPVQDAHLLYDYIDDDRLPDDVFYGLDPDGDGLPDEAAGHGTWVAGLVHLIAPDSSILPFRVLDNDGYGDQFVVAEAIRESVDKGADVINLSFSSIDMFPLMHDALVYAWSNDVLVVASGGNAGLADPMYPGASSCVLGVAAIDNQLIKAEWSNHGDWIDLSAPGVDIVSTFADPQNSPEPADVYARWSGTSAAAALVTGHAALLRSLTPAASAREVAAVIARTARSVDASNPEIAGLLGSGIPSVYASADWLGGGGTVALESGGPDPLGGCY